MLKLKKDISTRFQRVEKDIQSAMDVFTSTIANLTKSNEELNQLDSEIMEETTRLSKIQNGAKKQKEKNEKIIEKINTLLGE